MADSRTPPLDDTGQKENDLIDRFPQPSFLWFYVLKVFGYL